MCKWFCVLGSMFKSLILSWPVGRWVSHISTWNSGISSTPTPISKDTVSSTVRLWYFNIAIENGPCVVNLPIIDGGFPWLCGCLPGGMNQKIRHPHERMSFVPLLISWFRDPSCLYCRASQLPSSWKICTKFLQDFAAETATEKETIHWMIIVLWLLWMIFYIW